MKKLLLMPFYVAQLFTQAKSFNKYPVIGKRWINTLGLHVAHICIDHGIKRFRLLLLCQNVDPEHRKSFFEKGSILIDNYLDHETYRKLNAEIHEVDAEDRECT